MERVREEREGERRKRQRTTKGKEKDRGGETGARRGDPL